MRTFPFLLLIALVPVNSAQSQEVPANFVLVQGGAFKSAKSGYHGKNVTVSDFLIGKYEVTQKEWTEVMGDNPSEFKGDNLPVETVSWYDCIEYCNRRSLKEGLKPYYNLDKGRKDPDNGNENDDLKWVATINPGANGYRLPTEAEWEYAASGGRISKSHIYSGSDDIDKVAWFWQNSGDTRLAGLWNWPAVQNNNCKSKPIGSKEPNELGLYDMSGNVREWCWDWLSDLPDNTTDPQGSHGGAMRVWKGGGWLGGDFCCEISFRSGFEANGKGPDQGIRVCRSP